MLLDDVMSELDMPRRARLVDLLRERGQSVITTTELGHVPGADEPGVERVAIAEGRVRGRRSRPAVSVCGEPPGGRR